MNSAAGLICLAFGLALAGCDAAPEDPAQPVFGVLLITNRTGYAIDTIRYHETSLWPNVEMWSRNLLDDEPDGVSSIKSGSSVSLLMPPGEYDFKLQDASSTRAWRFSHVIVPWNGTVRIVAE